jgi:2-iminobutanoate/2-iminopropanoate deaminase
MAHRVIVSQKVANSSAPVSQAVRTGNTIYVSGQIALDADGRLVGKGDPAAQTEQVIQNVIALLEADGASLRDVVKLTVFVTDMQHLPAILEVRRRHFSEPYPAVSLVEVSRLVNPDLLVEIEAIATTGGA